MDRIMQISADHTDSLDVVRAGQIVALHGITNVQTGDTLITPKDAPSFMLEPIHPIAPVFTVNVEAENQVQLTKLEKVLTVLSKEDPSLHVENDEESAQLLLSGMGELHLEVLQQRLKREFGLEAFYSKMRVNYRETVGEESTLTGEYDRTVNNRSYHVKVGVEVSPSMKDENEVIVDVNKYLFVWFCDVDSTRRYVLRMKWLMFFEKAFNLVSHVDLFLDTPCIM